MNGGEETYDMFDINVPLHYPVPTLGYKFLHELYRRYSLSLATDIVDLILDDVTPLKTQTGRYFFRNQIRMMSYSMRIFMRI